MRGGDDGSVSGRGDDRDEVRKKETVIVKEGVAGGVETMSCQNWLLWMSGVVIRRFWPTRKQTSETEYLASSVVALVEAGTYGIASEEDTGRRLQKVGCPCGPLSSQVRGQPRPSS